MQNLIDELKKAALRGELKADGKYRPLSEEQMVTAEFELGFKLPDVLRRIYTEVANGGFGQSYGLLGLKGGMLNEDYFDAVSQYKLYRKDYPEEPHWHWPEGLLPVGHLGCAMYCCVDCTKADGPVIWFEPNPHRMGESWDDSFIPLANSTYEWIAAWLRGEDLLKKLIADK